MASETRSNAMRTVTLKNDTTSGYELHQRGKNPTLTLPYNPPPEAPASLVSSARRKAGSAAKLDQTASSPRLKGNA